MAEEIKNNSENLSDKNNTKKDERIIRDEKGHFVSSNGKKVKKPSKQNVEDENIVKIKIIKKEEPLPPKDFEGKLEDMKERTATQFIKSVCRLNPSRISIDGNKYYSQAIVDSLVGESIEKEDDLQKTTELMEKANQTLLQGIKTIIVLKKCLYKVERARAIWRGVAIGLLVTFISYFGTKAIQRFCATEKPTATVVEQTAGVPQK